MSFKIYDALTQLLEQQQLDTAGFLDDAERASSMQSIGIWVSHPAPPGRRACKAPRTRVLGFCLIPDSTGIQGPFFPVYWGAAAKPDSISWAQNISIKLSFSNPNLI